MVIKNLEKFKRDYPRAYKGVKYGGKALQIAQSAYTMATTVAAIINSEKKYYDVAVAWNTDTTAALSPLTSMDEGTTAITRNGNSIAMKSLQIEGHLLWDNSAPGEEVRIMLVKDYNSVKGVAPTITDILESSSIIALRNKNEPKRFKVLMDRLYVNPMQQRATHIQIYKKFKMSKDKRGNPTVAKTATFKGATDDDFDKNHIWLVMLSNTATASTAANIALNSRLRFYDN